MGSLNNPSCRVIARNSRKVRKNIHDLHSTAKAALFKNYSKKPQSIAKQRM